MNAAKPAGIQCIGKKYIAGVYKAIAHNSDQLCYTDKD